MDVWTLTIIAALGTLIGGITLGLFNASVKLFYKKVWARFNNQPLIKPKIMGEMKTLEIEILPMLRKINAIPSYPDALKAKGIRDILLDIGDKAKTIKDKRFEELRDRLIQFSDNSDAIDVNTNPLTILKLLGRDTAMNLMNDIYTNISDTMKEKKKM